MPIYETFAKRKRRLEQTGEPQVYQYDHLPQPFRMQVVHILRGVFGPYGTTYNTKYQGRAVPVPKRGNKYWQNVHDTLARELGVEYLRKPGPTAKNVQGLCEQFLLEAPADDALSLVELAFQVMLDQMRPAGEPSVGAVDEAITELNHRFREHAIGYQFLERQLVRVDSEYLHAEVVEPAVRLLYATGFDGPLDEFLQAHAHLRQGEHRQAITEANKAFESTLKAICDARGWTYGKAATAWPLVELVMKHGLIPEDLQAHFGALKSVLGAGLPTVRNRPGSGHGQGPQVVDVPEHVAAYALHMAAANIVFLIQAHREMPDADQ